MMRAKLHQEQQIDNKCVALKLAIKLAAQTSLTPSDEYSNNLPLIWHLNMNAARQGFASTLSSRGLSVRRLDWAS
jgi:hypothetical protein